jgi:hypothetical protein
MGSPDRQAQIAMEFLFMVMLAFIFLIVILLIAYAYFHQAAEERRAAAVQDLALLLKRELLVAATVEDGYRRNVTLPSTVDGLSYTVSLSETTLTVTLADGKSGSTIIPEVTSGTFLPGENALRKNDDAITIEQP